MPRCYILSTRNGGPTIRGNPLKYLTYAATAILLSLTVSSAFAQQGTPHSFSSEVQIPGHPPPPPTCSDTSCIDAQKAYAEYYKTYLDGLAATQLRTFNWQFWTSVVLLVVVVVICISGVIFSGFQLYSATAQDFRGRNADRLNADHLAANKPDQLAANVELSWQSVRVTSSVIGLVVLVISLAFFYLFLKDVYPISAVGGAIPTPAATPAGSTSNVTTPNSTHNREF